MPAAQSADNSPFEAPSDQGTWCLEQSGLHGLPASDTATGLPRRQPRQAAVS
jgi:hypothetical protein